MNTVILLAGGTGERMQPIELPKQFIILDGKPVIIHTLEAFEQHPEIDAVIISCLESWIPACAGYVYEYGIKKVKKIVVGGKTGQASIKNALDVIAKDAEKRDIVLVHDAVRPLVSQEQITQCLRTVETFGNAVAVLPSAEAMLYSDDNVISSRVIDRYKLYRTQTPQGFFVSDLVETHRKAKEKNITNSVASCTLVVETGGKIYFCAGDDENIKITRKSDLQLVRAIMLYHKMGDRL